MYVSVCVGGWQGAPPPNSVYTYISLLELCPRVKSEDEQDEEDAQAQAEEHDRPTADATEPARLTPRRGRALVLVPHHQRRYHRAERVGGRVQRERGK